MKSPLNRTHLYCALLILCFLILALLAVPFDATNLGQQTSAVKGQETSPVAPVKLRFPVTVLDKKGIFVSGLTKEAFTVWEGNAQREIDYFSSAQMLASIAVLIDGSGSVQPRVLEAAKYATARFIGQSHPGNEYFIGEFSNIWRDSTGWMRDSQTVAEALNRIVAAPPAEAAAKRKPNGQTSFYDACAAALDSVMQRQHPKHVLLVITDGQDNQSRHTFKEIRNRIIAADVQIYGVGIVQTDNPNGLNLVGQAILDELATVSGGRAYFPKYSKDRKELNEAVDRIALELRHQYMIGFTPANMAQGGKWNKVKIKVTLPDASVKGLSVRSREGYFSPKPAP